MAESRLQRTVWRWHFYAGLVVAPFLLVLAVTGAIYLFGEDLNDALMPELRFVAPVAQPLPPSRLVAAALAAHPGTARKIDLPGRADRPATVTVVPQAGEPLQVVVDPGSGRVLGTVVHARTVPGFAETVHGSLFLGTWGRALVELAACWALVLVASGLYLWWPRGNPSLAGVLWPRLGERGRLFWRDLHAVTGVWATVLIAFMLLTGLPWAWVQGPLVRGGLAALGVGNVAQGFGAAPPQSVTLGEALGRVPWSQETLPMPASDPAHAGHGGGAAAPAGPDLAAIAGADAIAAQAAARGLRGGYSLHLPSGPTGIYTVSNFPGQPEQQRTLQFDRWTQRLIGENGWQHYGVGAKAIELGVQIHMGRYFGRANQLLMLLPCIAIVVLVVTGFTMWWRRRPQGSLGAPAPLRGARLRGALTLLVVAGVLLPLFGASLLVLAAVDRVVAARRAALA